MIPAIKYKIKEVLAEQRLITVEYFNEQHAVEMAISPFDLTGALLTGDALAAKITQHVPRAQFVQAAALLDAPQSMDAIVALVDQEFGEYVAPLTPTPIKAAVLEV